MIKFETFGVGPDTGRDATPAWNRLLEYLDAKPDDAPVTIVFQPGRYDFYAEHAAEREYYVSNHTQTGRKKCGLLLENRHGVTLDGGGAEFIFHGTLIPVAVVDSTDCTLKNFSIDYHYPPVHQLRIRSVDATRKCVVAEVCSDEAYRIEDGRNLRFTAEDNAGYPLDSSVFFTADGRMAYNLPDQPFNPENITELAPKLVEISGWRDDLQAGVRMVLRVSPRPTPGIFLYHADHARIENVTVHFAFGMGLLAQVTETISLNGFRVCRRGADDPRLFTTHADATHFSGCKGLIRSEHGLYEGMNDDAINVHGTYLKILECRGDREIRAAYMHPDCWGLEWGRPGDVVQMVRSQTMESVGATSRIASICPVDAATYVGAKVFDLTLDQPLPAMPVENGAYGIENLSWTPEVIFRDNTIRNNRARGVLFSTPRRVVCEHNVFDHVHGSAILLCGDCNGWYETGACHEVVIRNNRFINNLTAYYQFTKAVISIYPEIPDLAGQRRFFHSNITICDNEFAMFDAPLLYVKSAEHVRFSGNTIRYNDEFPAFHENRHTFLFEHVADVVIENNDFGDQNALESDIEISYSQPSAVTITPAPSEAGRAGGPRL